MLNFGKKEKGKRMYCTVICTKTGVIDGHTFNKGEIYPIVGGNNGQQLVYENKISDATVVHLFNYAYSNDGELADTERSEKSAWFDYYEVLGEKVRR